MSSKTTSRTVFACQQCGNQSSRWLGRCSECGNWNTYVEEQVRTQPAHTGKSTLLLQLSHDVAQTFGPVLYVSGEESVQQLKLRADRLGIGGDRLLVLAENDLDAIVEQVTQIRPTLAVIDSIQTVFMESV